MGLRRGIWLMLPMWLLFAGDIALTLAGQPSAYWAGEYDTAVEANPFALPILICGPWAFAGLAVAWALVLGVAAICWSHALVKWVVIVATVLHAIGGCTWLAQMGGWGWLIAVGYMAVAAELAWWCWHRSALDESKQNQRP